MTPAEFKSTRESLHLTVKWLASHMRVRRQSVQRWENGRFPIPDSVERLACALEFSRGHLPDMSFFCRMSYTYTSRAAAATASSSMSAPYSQ